MKKIIVLVGFFALMTASASLIMIEGCNGKIAPLSSIVVTATETFTPLPTIQISDFQSYGIGNNPNGTNINPGLENSISGSAGFTTFIPAGAPVNGVISPTAAVQQFGDSALGDIFAARMNATWSDGAPASYNYPSAQMFAKLFSGTAFYQIPPGLTGIKFYLYIPTMTTTAAGPNYTFQFQIGLSQIIGTASGGLCANTPGNTCYDNWNYTIPVNVALKSGYVLETVPFTSLAFAYAFNTTTTPNPCSLTTFIDGCNNNNVMELEWEGNSNAVAGNYAIDFRVDDVTFY